MVERIHAHRTFLQATYTPLDATKRRATPPPRPWEGFNLVAAFKARAAELGPVRERLKDFVRDPGDIDPVPYQRALDAVEQIVGAEGSSDALSSVPFLRQVEARALIWIAETLLALRKESVQETLSLATVLSDSFELERVREVRQHTIPLDGGWREAALVVPGRPELRVLTLHQPMLLEPSSDRAARGRGLSSARLVAALPRVLPSFTPRLSVNQLLEWASQNETHSATVTMLRSLTSDLGASSSALTLGELGSVAQRRLGALQNVVDGYKRRMGIEPVGLLHLERVTFTPAGTERGELVYSVPLAPGEEVNIAHKEWANTSEELERIVTDSLEGFSEQGVAEKAEISQATMSQTQHTSGFNTGVTASGGFGPINISSSFGYNVSDSATRSEQNSRRQTSELTRRASTRAKQEHKVSFKVASAAGTEDQTVRRLKNPATDHAIRIDYYQLLRKWRVDLYRYGVRLTYDISVPEPGLAILSKIRRIQELQDLLSHPNTLPTDFPDSALAFNPEEYPLLLAKYGGAPVEGLPNLTDTMSISDIKSFTDTHASESMPDYYPLSASVPEGYEVESASLAYSVRTFRDPDNNHPGVFRVILAGERSFIASRQAPDNVTVPKTLLDTDVDVTGLLGRSGDITLLYQVSYLQDVAIVLDLELRLKSEVVDKWRIKAWTALRDAVLATQELERQSLRDELLRLQQELGGQDALSLRKAEREEVMRGVLRWLFGPSFEYYPAGVPAELYDARGGVSQASYERVSALGEVIKFIHHAIEWENMTYILYPYFWSHPDNWELKKYLQHPDLQHQAFLKAGSTRVVITIRPGFEREFVNFMSGYFEPGAGTLPESDDYLTIAEEMRLFALTNYPGIPPANPEDDARPLLTPRQHKAWDDMQSIARLLERYKAFRGSYPSTEQGLGVLAQATDPVTPTVPEHDPWGQPFQYVAPGIRGEYELASLGEDAAAGGDGEAQDITSWAPASLVGRWYEYTPTSALDIAVANDLALPDA